MRLYVLPLLIGFLAGLVLDLSVTRFVLDFILFSTVLVAAVVALLIAHYHGPRKKLSSRRQSDLVKTRKVAKSR